MRHSSMILAASLSIHWVRTNMLEATVGVLTLAHLIPHADLLEGAVLLNLCNPLNPPLGFSRTLLAFGFPLAFAFRSFQSGR